MDRAGHPWDTGELFQQQLVHRNQVPRIVGHNRDDNQSSGQKPLYDWEELVVHATAPYIRFLYQKPQHVICLFHKMPRARAVVCFVAQKEFGDRGAPCAPRESPRGGRRFVGVGAASRRADAISIDATIIISVARIAKHTYRTLFTSILLGIGK